MKPRDLLWSLVGVATSVISFGAFVTYRARHRDKRDKLKCPWCDKRFTCDPGKSNEGIAYHQEYDCPEWDEE